MGYKWCVVPQCTNTSINSPLKMFVSVPTISKRRKMWLQLARRDPESIAPHSNVFMCEDHFDMAKDTINYMKYKMGFSQKILLTDEAVPTKFHCQEDRKRRLSVAGHSREAFLKRQKIDLVTECLQSQSITETHAESFQKDENEIQEMIEPEVKEETIDGECEPLPTQCQDQQMATVKSELDVASVTTQPVDEVVIKEEIEVGPTEFLPQYHTTEVPYCKVEPGTSESNMSSCYNAPYDGAMSNYGSSSTNFGSEGLIACSKYTQNRELIQHVQTNTGEKPFACDLCSYRSKRNCALLVHMRTHTGEKPFACDFCSYKCKMKCMLVMHKRTHTGEKPFACNLCSFKGIQKSALLVHMRTHTGVKPFACDLCSYECKVKSSLVVHRRTHTGEKPFACDLCSYKCKVRSALVVHKRGHTGERPYACELCSYKCKENRDLVRHMRVHTE